MTTVRSIITKAMRKVQILAAGEDPSAAEGADGLDAFNEMMAGLKLESIPLDWRNLTLDDDVPLPPEHIRGVIHLLGVELAPEYGKEVDPTIALIAERARRLLQGHYKDIRQMSVDPGLIDRRAGTFDINEG
jgi:hypothetical protein